MEQIFILIFLCSVIITEVEPNRTQKPTQDLISGSYPKLRRPWTRIRYRTSDSNLDENLDTNADGGTHASGSYGWDVADKHGKLARVDVKFDTDGIDRQTDLYDQGDWSNDQSNGNSDVNNKTISTTTPTPRLKSSKEEIIDLIETYFTEDMKANTKLYEKADKKKIYDAIPKIVDIYLKNKIEFNNKAARDMIQAIKAQYDIGNQAKT